MINYARLYHKLTRDIGDAIYTIEHPKDTAENINSQVLDLLIKSITEAEEMYLDMCEEAYPNGEDLDENQEDYEDPDEYGDFYDPDNEEEE